MIGDEISILVKITLAFLFITTSSLEVKTILVKDEYNLTQHLNTKQRTLKTERSNPVLIGIT